MEAGDWLMATLQSNFEIELFPRPGSAIASLAAKALRVAACFSTSVHEALLAAGDLLPELVNRLKNGDAVEREQAAAEVARWFAPDRNPSNALLSIVLPAGFAPPLVAILRDGSSNGKVQAAAALAGLANFGDNVLEAGALPPLVTCLISGTDAVAAAAAQLVAAIYEGTYNEDYNEEMIAVALPALLALLAPERSAAVQEAAATVINCMWEQDVFDDSQPADIQLLSQRLLVALLSGADGVRAPAARVLCKLPRPMLCDLLLGSLPALVQMLSAVGDGEKAAVLLVLGLGKVSPMDAYDMDFTEHPHYVDAVIAAGALPALAQLFRHESSVCAAMQAFDSLYVISGGARTALCQGMLAAGAAAPLLEHIRGGGKNIFTAAEVIASLFAMASDQQRSAIIGSGAVPLLLNAAQNQHSPLRDELADAVALLLRDE